MEQIKVISKALFDDVYQITHQTKVFLDKVDETYDLKSHVSNLDFIQRISFFADILKCYRLLDYSFSPNTSEGQCLLVAFLSIVVNPSNFEYETLENLILSNTDEVARLRKSLFDNISVNEDLCDTFKIDNVDYCNQSSNLPITSKLIYARLLGINKDVQSQYLLKIYRCMSCFIKSNGTITDKETSFLNQLSTEREIIISEQNNKAVSEMATPLNTNPIEELMSLVGLSTVKTEINDLANLVNIQNIRAKRGMKVSSVSYHCVFTGNPGTGKTTVARIIAEIYKQLGVLKKGHLVETDRSGLVAEYVGQTAPKTNAIIDSALDGVLFIDEAYSLAQGGSSDFGGEAIATLLKRMEDDRDRLVVILAGYSSEMQQFINSNSGLQSRFSRYVHFPDYSCDELMQIFNYIINKNDFIIEDDALSEVRAIIQNALNKKDQNFGNARYIRNLFEKVITQQANRLTIQTDITNEMLRQITVSDILNCQSYL